MKMLASMTVAPDHPSFVGHFPKFPLLAGAILLDQILQLIEAARGIDLLQWHLASAKFLDIVRPGDQLSLEHDFSQPGSIHFTVLIENRKVASGTLSSGQ